MIVNLALMCHKENESNDGECTLGIIEKGEVIGEVSFIDNKPRSASVRAELDSELVPVPYDKFRKLLDDGPPIVLSLVKTLCDRLRKANCKISV